MVRLILQRMNKRQVYGRPLNNNDPTILGLRQVTVVLKMNFQTVWTENARD